MIKYLTENGYPANLTSTRENLPYDGESIKICSEIKVFLDNGKELFNERRIFADNEERKTYINGIMKGMEIVLK